MYIPECIWLLRCRLTCLTVQSQCHTNAHHPTSSNNLLMHTNMYRITARTYCDASSHILLYNAESLSLFLAGWRHVKLCACIHACLSCWSGEWHSDI